MMLSTQRSPLAPLKKGGKRLKVPLFKGDLGGSCFLLLAKGLLKHALRIVCSCLLRCRVSLWLNLGRKMRLLQSPKSPDKGGKGVLYGKSPDNIQFLKIDGKNPDNPLDKGIVRKDSDELIVSIPRAWHRQGERN